MQFDEMTGSLAPAADDKVSPRPISWPYDIDDATKAAVLADVDFVAYLSGQPPQEQQRQICLWRPRGPQLSRTEQYRQQLAQKEASAKRAEEQAALLAPQSLYRLIQSLEADAIVMRMRIAALEAAQPARPATVSRIPRKSSSSTPPDAA